MTTVGSTTKPAACSHHRFMRLALLQRAAGAAFLRKTHARLGVGDGLGDKLIEAFPSGLGLERRFLVNLR